MLMVLSPLWAHPAPGTPAPSLQGVQLLQPAAGGTTDWAGLRKVVVLDFWATWCSPCVAGLPHLNELVAALDPAKFQFLSVDDEDPGVIRNFLGKKTMTGSVGTDPSGGVFGRYGVIARPTTVIVDGNGKVVAITDLQTVSAADLRAVAAGQPVTFKPLAEVTETTGVSPTSAAAPLFSVTITQAAPDAPMSHVKHPPTGTDLLGEDADSLLVDLLNPFAGRYLLRGSLPPGKFDLRISSDETAHAANDPVVVQAVLAVMHLQMRSVTLTKPAYLLRKSAGAKLLSSSASTHATKRGSWHGLAILMNGSMDDLATILSTALETPVIDQTGLPGRYDARFALPGGSLDDINKVLRHETGLELIPGTETRSLTVNEVSPRN